MNDEIDRTKAKGGAMSRAHEALVKGATLPMALVASDGALLTTSPPWDRLFLGAAGTLAELLVESDSDRAGELLLSGVRVEERVVSVRVRADDARWLRLQATLLPDQGDEGALLVVATDATSERAEIVELKDRVQFMEWQALSLSTFAKAMGSAHLVLFSMDPSGVTTMSDGRGLELIGLKPGERVGRNELAVTAGTPAHDYLRRALAGEDLRVLLEPAPGVFFDTWFTPLRDEGNRLDGVLGLSIDATERVLSERRLAEKVQVIERQTATIRDLAAPVLRIWAEVVCMPVIGAVDALRAADMMERLLEAIVREKARYAILDLTGVELMDTTTVHHMLRIFAAARTVGAEGVLSGVRPAVAQSVVSLRIDTTGLRMVRTLHDALAWCLDQAPSARQRTA